jgi:hypothetical protein
VKFVASPAIMENALNINFSQAKETNMRRMLIAFPNPISDQTSNPSNKSGNAMPNGIPPVPKKNTMPFTAIKS